MQAPQFARDIVAKLQSPSWSFTKVITLVGMLWAALLIVFHEGRMCYPWRTECQKQFFTTIGDAVWLRGFEDWQTLVAGLIAIVAAIVGGRYINKQIQQTEETERERRNREFEAARAMMPIYLDALIEYIETCGKRLKSLEMMASVGERQTPAFPPLPMDVATFFRDLILRSPADLRIPVIEILSELQVFNARLSSFAYRLSRGTSTNAIEDYVVQAADLYGRCIALLPFARNKSNDIPNAAMARSHYMTALSIMGFDDQQHGGLIARMGRIVAGVETTAQTSET